MTNQEAIEKFEKIKRGNIFLIHQRIEGKEVIEDYSLCDMAISALEKLDSVPSAQPEPCEDAVSRNAIIQKLNTMDRYVSEELRLCDTDKKFPKNEVFIVDDVYEEIVENLPSAQPEIIRCKDCKYRGGLSGFYCDIVEKAVGVDNFCSWAERKTDE